MEETNAMPQKPSAGLSALVYGLLLSVVMIVAYLLLYLLDYNKSAVATIIPILLLVAGVALASADYRNKKLGGFISYGKAVKIGFLTVLFAAFVIAVYTFVYHSAINPGELNQLKKDSILAIYNMDLEPEKEAQAVQMQKYIFNPLTFSVISIFSLAFFGIIIALITSIFIKRDQPAGYSI
jgi:hypothetical protein